MNITIVITQRFGYTTLIQDHWTDDYSTHDSLTKPKE